MLVAGLFNGGRSEGASGWVVQWRMVSGCKWLGCSLEGDLTVLVAGLFIGEKSDNTHPHQYEGRTQNFRLIEGRHQKVID